MTECFQVPCINKRNSGSAPQTLYVEADLFDWSEENHQITMHFLNKKIRITNSNHFHSRSNHIGLYVEILVNKSIHIKKLQLNTCTVHIIITKSN